jgi:(4S)-4-hydroxy-5-phosphonooxypentane-2,3-dione isomerase
MNRFVLIVDFQVKPEHLDKFNQLIDVNARSSVANEPGCLQFDVLRNHENPGNVVLYEVYDSEDAFKAHLGMSHTQTFLSQMKEFIIKQTATRFTRVVAPPVKPS